MIKRKEFTLKVNLQRGVLTLCTLRSLWLTAESRISGDVKIATLSGGSWPFDCQME